MQTVMPTRQSTTAILALLAFVSLIATWPNRHARAADHPLQKINVAYSSISGNVSPLWVTQEKGFFRKYGLDVQVVFIESGTTTVQKLAAGNVSFASVAGPAVIQSNLRGADVVMIAGVINTLTLQLYTEKGIIRPDQFKGKALGVTRFGSATDFAMRYAIDRYGLDASKDLTIHQLGNQPALLAALDAGRVQGVMLSAPTSMRAKKLGFPMLADLRMLGLEFQHTSIATSRALIQSKPNMVRDFMRAYIEGIHYAKTHRKETLEILAKYLRTEETEVLIDTYEAIIMTLVPQKPYPTKKGVQIILRELGQHDAAARAARPEQFVDLSIIKDLDSSGFIDQLYKAGALAKSAPRTEPVPTPAPKREETVVQVTEAKSTPATNEETVKALSEPPPAVRAPAPTPNPTSGGQKYTVKAGDTLSNIAERFYSSTDKWDKIFQANRETLKNPNYIDVGTKLVIPANSH